MDIRHCNNLLDNVSGLSPNPSQIVQNPRLKDTGSNEPRLISLHNLAQLYVSACTNTSIGDCQRESQ